jgi:hypothetical protein
MSALRHWGFLTRLQFWIGKQSACYRKKFQSLVEYSLNTDAICEGKDGGALAPPFGMMGPVFFTE